MSASSGMSDRLPLLAFLLFWAASCLDPPYPRELILQHVPTALALAALVAASRRRLLSRSSERLVLAFLALHVVGARWLYSNVPYDDWIAAIFGQGLSSLFGFTRNHYDRLVHFAYGLLLVCPACEVFRRLHLPSRWAWLLALQFILATSALYEIGEWCVAIVFAPDWAEQYNGQQGDLWDSQKDMLLAAAGAVAVCAWRAVTKPRQASDPIN